MQAADKVDAQNALDGPGASAYGELPALSASI
jgi:hypothetical protein